MTPNPLPPFVGDLLAAYGWSVLTFSALAVAIAAVAWAHSRPPGPCAYLVVESDGVAVAIHETRLRASHRVIRHGLTFDHAAAIARRLREAAEDEPRQVL